MLATKSEKRASTNRSRTKGVLDPKDQVHSVKKVLDAILLEGTELSPEIRQQVAAARDRTWQEYKEREEAVMAKAR